MQKTCEERIDDHMADALEDIATTQHTYRLECAECGHVWHDAEKEYECIECESDDIDTDNAHDSYMEGVLEISPLYIVYQVGLSYGGPADGFYLYVDPDDKTIDKVEYYFQDWFDGAKRTLHGEKLDLVRNMFEPYIQS